jgi:hypothetical protein
VSVLTRGPMLLAREGEKMVPIREMSRWATGSFSDLGRNGSRGPISYFSFSSSFSFLFSYFLHRFCILNSNDFKPKAKVF